MLGNPLYLLGTSLARYRIWDGMRGLDYLTSRPEVDPSGSAASATRAAARSRPTSRRSTRG